MARRAVLENDRSNLLRKRDRGITARAGLRREKQSDQSNPLRVPNHLSKLPGKLVADNGFQPRISGYCFASIFAQVSFKVTVRLNTGLPGVESFGSAKK